MSKTQIRGGSTTGVSQIQDGTVFDLQLAAAAGIQTSKLAQGGLFMLSTGATMSGPLNMGSGSPTAPAGMQPIQQLADPTNAQDAATKNYVDSRLASGTGTGASTKAATTVNLTLSGTQTVDGVALSVGDTILVKNQSSPQNNGIYVVASGAWTRAANMNTWAQVPGMIISVEMGTTNADTVWLSTADPGGTLGTTPITFIQLPGPSDIQAGLGLQRSGQALNVINTDNSLTATGTAGLNNGNLSVKLDPARAITVVAAGIGVNTNNSLNFTGNKLNVDGGVVLWKTDLVIRETVSGTINGSNTAFTLANSPVTGSEMIYQNGLLLESGAGNDYTISGQNITMLTAPATGDRLKATYMKGATPVTPT